MRVADQLVRGDRDLRDREDPGDTPFAAGTDDADAAESGGRWHVLLDAVVTMAAGLSLDELLARIVEVAAELAHARYGALGVIDPDEETTKRLRLLATHGVDEDAVARISELPQGHGLLGLLIDRPEPLRAREILAHPDHVGFPPGHPPMHTFLGVPIRIRDEVFGNLYLTDRLDGSDFTDQDEQIVTALAAAAGVAIENARLREEGARRERWLAGAADLATTLLWPGADATALQIVADRARELARADVAWLVAGPDEAHLRLQVLSGALADPEAMAAVDFIDSVERAAAVSGRPVTVKNLAADARTADLSRMLGLPAGPGVVVPLRSSIGVEGVVGLGWWSDADAMDLAQDATLPALLAERAALALHVARTRRDQERLAVLEDRDRIARDLHDLVIQRLFAVGLELQGTASLKDPEEMGRRLDRTVDDIDITIRDIRRTIFGLGSLHDASDPRALIVEVVERAARTMKFRPILAFRGPVRSLLDGDLLPDTLAVLTEALSNAVRHAEASLCEVEVAVDDGLTVRVTDDGCGMPESVSESGLANIRLRAEARGGRFTVTTSPDRGTSLVWWVPRSCAGPAGQGADGAAAL